MISAKQFRQIGDVSMILETIDVAVNVLNDRIYDLDYYDAQHLADIIAKLLEINKKLLKIFAIGE